MAHFIKILFIACFINITNALEAIHIGEIKNNFNNDVSLYVRRDSGHVGVIRKKITLTPGKTLTAFSYPGNVLIVVGAGPEKKSHWLEDGSYPAITIAKSGEITSNGQRLFD